MIIGLVAFAIVVGGATIYYAVRSREFRKFLERRDTTYLYFAGVSVPLLGTKLVQTPAISGLRAIPHLLFSLITFYFGFIAKPRGSTVGSDAGRSS